MKPTLLIVDDEKTTREGLRAALEERYDVYMAEDAKAAMNCWNAKISTCCSRISGCRTRTA
jgi:two-component system, NtrC family, response regulator AtoC